MKNTLIQQARPYYDHFMIAAIEDEVLEKNNDGTSVAGIIIDQGLHG